MSGAMLPDLAAPPARAAASRFSNILGPFLGLLLIILVGGLAEAAKEGTLRYWGLPNQMLILTQTVTVAIGAIGMTIIIIAGGIDLSVGSLIALTSVTAAWVVKSWSPAGAATVEGPMAVYLPLLALASAVALGAAAGAVNGGLITGLRLAPFIITLGMMSFARGAAKWVAHEQKIDAPMNWIGEFTASNLRFFHSGFYRELTLPLLGPLKVDWRGPVATSSAVLVTLLLGGMAAVLLARTRFGRHVFAIGSNEGTARLCGVRVEWTKILIYALAGAMFGLAGATDFGRLSSGNPTTALGKELDIIAAVVIGGGSLAGGSGTILGSLIGALLMAHLRNLCIHLGLPSFVQEMVVGAVIIVAVAVDHYRQKRQRA